MSRTERIGLVVNRREKAALTRLAEAEGGLSYAALIRRLVRDAARRGGLWPVSEGDTELSARQHAREVGE
jgi:hypothetical protein